MSTSKSTKAVQAVTITKAQAPAIVAALLRKYKSVSGIRKAEAEIRSKYGPKAWPIIKAEAKAQRVEAIKAHEAGAKAGILAWEPALNEAYRAARKSGDFGKLEAMAAAKYATGTEFIAACYSNVIDGAPAMRVAYVTGKPGACTIVEAFRPIALDGRKARALMYVAIGNFAKAIAKAEGKAGAYYEEPAQAREAGKIVAAYNTKPGARMGTIAKAAPVEEEEAKAYKAGNVAGLETLSAYNAEAAKLYELAKAAEAMAIMEGKPIEMKWAQVLTLEPRHRAQAAKAPAKPKGIRKPKAAKAPAQEEPKAAPVSPEAIAQAQEAMAQAEAFIEANRAQAEANKIELQA